jgi:hypothetical protein
MISEHLKQCDMKELLILIHLIIALIGVIIGIVAILGPHLETWWHGVLVTYVLIMIIVFGCVGIAKIMEKIKS